MDSLRVKLTTGYISARLYLLISVTNSGDDTVPVVRTITLQGNAAHFIDLPLDSTLGITTTRPLPALLYPSDRLLVSLPFQALTQLEPLFFLPLQVSAHVRDMTGETFSSLPVTLHAPTE
ncbi:hypothetical protein GO986_06035 [Deinococcus sp. HMF7620]|uniref:Uncharacterized protein n=1 Tax=Deinococcus arboris TaxID=2682977 RepID=A0A7C9LT07_9DEIO|nr:hypothetical protein [Deinococcus arboris]MVN86320.1 hypothetical protein [Deinococcus arboris]